MLTVIDSVIDFHTGFSLLVGNRRDVYTAKINKFFVNDAQFFMVTTIYSGEEGVKMAKECIDAKPAKKRERVIDPNFYIVIKYCVINLTNPLF